MGEVVGMMTVSCMNKNVFICNHSSLSSVSSVAPKGQLMTQNRDN